MVAILKITGFEWIVAGLCELVNVATLCKLAVAVVVKRCKLVIVARLKSDRLGQEVARLCRLGTRSAVAVTEGMPYAR